MRALKIKVKKLNHRHGIFPAWLVACCLLAGCNYTSPSNQFGDEVAVMTVPLIRGDEDGYLRIGLAREISQTPGYAYSSSDGSYRVDVKIVKDSAETIGYAWDEKPITGEFIQRLYPNEARRNVKAMVSVTDIQQNKVVIDPFEVVASTDYDFVNPTALKNIEFTGVDGEGHSVLQYSMGQLDSEEGARGEAFAALANNLSKMIMGALKRAPVKR